MHKLGADARERRGAAVDGAVDRAAERHGMPSDSAWRRRAGLLAAERLRDRQSRRRRLRGRRRPDRLDAQRRLRLRAARHRLSRSLVFAVHRQRDAHQHQAQTMPSVTLSNYRPLTRFGFSTKCSWRRWSYSDQIGFEDGFTAGNPTLAGLRLSIEPAAGWSLERQSPDAVRRRRARRRFVQRLPRRASSSRARTTTATHGRASSAIRSPRGPAASFSRARHRSPSISSTPARNAHTKATTASAMRRCPLGINVPAAVAALRSHVRSVGVAERLVRARHLLDGLTNDGHVIGHWGADERVFERCASARRRTWCASGWEPGFGGLMQLRARTIANEDYGDVDYERGYDVSAELFAYAARLHRRRRTDGRAGRVRRELQPARRLRALRRRVGAAGSGAGRKSAKRPRRRGTVRRCRRQREPKSDPARRRQPDRRRLRGSRAARRIGARRAVSERSDLGVRAELDRIDDELLLAVRALDYRYRFRNPLALTFFVGAARYDLATPAYGYYMGAGVQWREISAGTSTSVSICVTPTRSRATSCLPDDPAQRCRARTVSTTSSARSLSLSYRF